MTQFQEHPDAWTRADAILEFAQVRETKCILFSYSFELTIVDLALSILEKLIQTRWKILPREQALGTFHQAPIFELRINFPKAYGTSLLR